MLLVGLSACLCGAVISAGVWTRDQEPSRDTASVEVVNRPVDGEKHPKHSSSRSVAPVRLEIPAIAVAVPLVRLGLMPDRTVEVPSNADLAGWFRRGPIPGRLGSAVILGHVDSLEGPAVFARLQELRAGDTVVVDRADGSTVRFVVQRSVLYANADFPADRVYGAQGARRVNLVTCGGSYDSARGGYQSNLVVYTRRAEA